MDNELEDKFDYNGESVLKLRARAALRLDLFTEVDGSSVFFA